MRAHNPIHDAKCRAVTRTVTRLLTDLHHQVVDSPTPVRRPDTNTNNTVAETVGTAAQLPTKEPKSAVIYTGAETQPSLAGLPQT